MDVFAALMSFVSAALVFFLGRERRARTTSDDHLRRVEREVRSQALDAAQDDHKEVVETPDPPPAPPEPEDTQEAEARKRRREIVAATLGAAAAEWKRVVKEPPQGDPDVIDGYIRRTGLGWPQGKTPPKTGPYERNRDFAWCGAFAAHCLAAAGLDATVRKKVMPSTYRIYDYASKNACLVKGEPQSGDIVLVGPKGSKWGAHITLCRSFDPQRRMALTVEGNAKGEGPNGQRYEGVVHGERPLAAADDRTYRVRHIVRLPLGVFSSAEDGVA